MILRLSTKFKKDLKHYQNHPAKIEALKVVLKHLKQSGYVPSEYRPHVLSGNYKGISAKDTLLLSRNAPSAEILSSVSGYTRAFCPTIKVRVLRLYLKNRGIIKGFWSGR